MSDFVVVVEALAIRKPLFATLDPTNIIITKILPLVCDLDPMKAPRALLQSESIERRLRWVKGADAADRDQFEGHTVLGFIVIGGAHQPQCFTGALTKHLLQIHRDLELEAILRDVWFVQRWKQTFQFHRECAEFHEAVSELCGLLVVTVKGVILEVCGLLVE